MASPTRAGSNELATSNRIKGAMSSGAHLTVRGSLGDVLNHPAFAGYAQLLLPWVERRYDPNMRLTDIGSLLPYHRHVNPQSVVDALNHMIDDVNAGKPVFFDLYTEPQKQADATKRHTGLFFYRGKPGAPFALIARGGRFSYVGSLHEGFPYAMEISATGSNAFVLKYRAGLGESVATQDMAAALSYIFRNAVALGVDTKDYSVWGSSAGARMAAAIGSHSIVNFGGDQLPKPAAVIMAYTAHSDYTSHEPPTFVVVGAQDTIYRAPREHATACGCSPQVRNSGRVPQVRGYRSRLRGRRGHERLRMDRRRNALLGTPDAWR